MVSVGDIKWAAGFLEGEGSFELGQHGYRVSAAQVQRDPIDRLKGLFCGTINLRHKPSRVMWKPAYHWQLCGARAVGLMMTLYSLMSPNRKVQIKRCLNDWKSRAIAPRFRTHCPQGHPYSRINTFVDKDGHRGCKSCARLRHVQRGLRKRRSGTTHSEFQLKLGF